MILYLELLYGAVREISCCISCIFKKPFEHFSYIYLNFEYLFYFFIFFLLFTYFNIHDDKILN